MLTKLRAEADPHPLSIDWNRAPEGTPELYWDLADLAIEAIRSGAPLAQVRTEGRPAFQLNGPWRDQVAWLLTGNGAALIEHPRRPDHPAPGPGGQAAVALSRRAA